jgi:hypothetical protein
LLNNGRDKRMRNCWRRWTAILLLALMPLPALAMALAPMADHACCDGQNATSPASTATKRCAEHSETRTPLLSCTSDSDRSSPAPHTSGACSQCLGLAGAAVALPNGHGAMLVATNGFIAVPAPAAHLPAPPPTRLDRPPRVFFS